MEQFYKSILLKIFETLGLKKLISTGYAADRKEQQYEQYHQMTLFELQSPQYDEQKSRAHGRIFTLERDANKSGVIDIDDLEWQYLDGDGDFRSDEVKPCATKQTSLLLTRHFLCSVNLLHGLWKLIRKLL